jgi:predicted RNA-binding Zn-ribbon protein involved in translation (DUF1610 family)
VWLVAGSCAPPVAKLKGGIINYPAKSSMPRRLGSGDEMPSCKECGKSLSPEAKFCPSCGAGVVTERVETTELKKQKVDAGAFLRCPKCGGMLKRTPMGGGLMYFDMAAWICPDCGYMGPIA